MENNNLLWEQIGKPKYALAPMVDYSDLPFRMLCRKYGTTLTFTPMYHSGNFATIEHYRQQCLKDINPSLDSPCFVQFCGHDPELLLQAAKYVEKLTPCVDLNLGCPQGIAKRGHYGSYLLDYPDEVYKIVGYLTNNLSIPLSCKIRLFPDLSKTFDLVTKLESLGIQVLTVHGRTKEEKKDKINKANWSAIKSIKELISIPLIANGGLETFEDIDRCFKETGCDCVMSGEKLLEMPFYFGKEMKDIDKIVFDYLDYCKEIEQDISFVKGHLYKFYYQACKMNNSFLAKIGSAQAIEECYSIAKEIEVLRKDVDLKEKFGWYRRYRDLNGKKKNVVNIGFNMINDEDNNLGDLFG